MGSGVGKIEEERARGMVAEVVANVARRLGADRVGGVEALLGLDQGVVTDQGRRLEEAARAADGAEEAVEAPRPGPAPAIFVIGFSIYLIATSRTPADAILDGSLP